MEHFCMHCLQPMKPSDRYCGQCGMKQMAYNSEIERSSVRNVIIFYVTYLLFAIVSYAVYLESDSLVTEITIEVVFILITILFSLFDVKRIIGLYNMRLITWKPLLFSVVFPIFTAGIVYYGVRLLDSLLFDETYNLFYDYIGYENGIFWAFLFIVIVAPIFEELAFRGFLYNQLRNVTSPKVTILATAIIFALVHFSFLSFIWIMPFGIVLGYLRHKYKTLWLGMLVHFIHNLLVMLLEYYYFSKDSIIDLLN